MSQMSDITLRELRNNTSAVLRRAEAGERLTVHVNRRPVAEIVPLDDRPAWLPGKEMIDGIRGRQADPALAAELRDAFPDVIDDLPS